MAPRKQAAKKAAAESVVVTAAADGNVTPPKKRKTAAKSATAEPTDEPKKAKGKSRQAKADKQESEEVASKPASPARKLRSRQKNTADNVIAVTKSETRSRARKQAKEPEDTAVADKKVAAKRTRDGKAVAVTKKAGIKMTPMKPKTKAPAVRKQRGKPTVENSAEDFEKKSDKIPAKRTVRRAKAVEESDVPAQLVAKGSRKRKNVEPANKAVIEAIEEEEEEERNEAKAAVKNLRSKPKKKETNDAPIVTSKGRSKKNLAREIASPQPKEVEIKKQNSKEQNAAIQEDSSKTKNVKYTKKENAKRAAPKRKLFTESSKEAEIEETPKATEAEEVVTLEMDVKENGEAHSVNENGETQPKQKKRDAGKANVAMNGKIETKGKQKKGQAAAVESDKKEAIKDVTAENKTTETKVTLEIDENGIKDVSSSGNDSIIEIGVGNNDSTLPIDEAVIKIENKASDAATPNNEKERSGTFLCY